VTDVLVGSYFAGVALVVVVGLWARVVAGFTGQSEGREN
jgi:hypothetical protein